MQGVRQISEIARSNVNVNDVFFQKTNVSNVNNVNVVCGKKKKSIQHVEHVGWIADRLVKEFSDPNSKRFFAKVAWSLSENEIWETLELAKRPCVENPAKYFTRVCKLKLRQIGK